MKLYIILITSLFLTSLVFHTQCNTSRSGSGLNINIDLVKTLDKVIFDEFDSEIACSELSPLPESDISEEETPGIINKDIALIAKTDYSTAKNDILTERKKLQVLYSKAVTQTDKKAIIDSSKQVLYDAILNKIIPHWYGTKYDFEGYTYKPYEGKIACGYFVSTVLRDAGLNLNRYDLAKQCPINEVKSIHLSDSIIRFNCSLEDFTDSVRSRLDEGLYYLGLSSHVGFLLYTNNELYIIHSDYIAGEVAIEHVLNSEAMEFENEFLLGEITTNDILAKKWLYNKHIDVITSEIAYN